jgi:hypothetical protein
VDTGFCFSKDDKGDTDTVAIFAIILKFHLLLSFIVFCQAKSRVGRVAGWLFDPPKPSSGWFIQPMPTF